MRFPRLTSSIFFASVCVMASPVYAGATFNLLPRLDFYDDPEIVTKDRDQTKGMCHTTQPGRDTLSEVCTLDLSHSDAPLKPRDDE